MEGAAKFWGMKEIGRFFKEGHMISMREVPGSAKRITHAKMNNGDHNLMIQSDVYLETARTKCWFHNYLELAAHSKGSKDEHSEPRSEEHRLHDNPNPLL